MCTAMWALEISGTIFRKYMLCVRRLLCNVFSRSLEFVDVECCLYVTRLQAYADLYCLLCSYMTESIITDYIYSLLCYC